MVTLGGGIESEQGTESGGGDPHPSLPDPGTVQSIHGSRGLPEGHGHCASLASGAIWKAINAYLSTQNEPWKRLYR